MAQSTHSMFSSKCHLNRQPTPARHVREARTERRERHLRGFIANIEGGDFGATSQQSRSEGQKNRKVGDDEDNPGCIWGRSGCSGVLDNYRLTAHNLATNIWLCKFF